MFGNCEAYTETMEFTGVTMSIYNREFSPTLYLPQMFNNPQNGCGCAYRHTMTDDQGGRYVW